MATERPSVRALQKQARQDDIVAAAETLIRDRGDTGFSMLDLAKAAGVSPATPYNLFGGKSAILYALLNRSADSIFTAAATHKESNADRVLDAADALARVLAGDPAFYKPLYAYLMGVMDASWRPAFMSRAHQYWAGAFMVDPASGTAIAPLIIADLLVTQALGCVELWVHGEIADAALSTELQRSAGAVVLGIVDTWERERLVPIIAAPRTLRFE